MDEQQHEDIPEQARAEERPVRRRRVATAVATAGLVALMSVGGLAIGGAVVGGTTAVASAPVALATPARYRPPNGNGYGYEYGNGYGFGSQGSASSTGSATAAEETGVVDIDTVLDYGAGEAAGTGLVLTSSGEILTNNHVIDGATTIKVTDVSTGSTYDAHVVGSDAGDDVAVLQLSGASGLATANLASADQQAAVAVGTAVTAVGNAGGTGGTPSAATGSVVALGQDITASDETGANAEQLSGLIRVDADVEAGDSGGPLYAGGVVIGIDTAASSSNSMRGGMVDTAASTSTAGFAIPIGTALSIADRIESGATSGGIQQGTPAFLGVSLAGSGAATVGGVLGSSPAQSAGLAAGDTITAVDGTAVGSAGALSSLLGAHQPGDRVAVSWTDAQGAAHTATVTLAAGPAA